jgi:hypothetical protein
MLTRSNINDISNLAEMIFDVEAGARGISISKPVTSFSAYDRVAEVGGVMKKVQIKCITAMTNKTYRARLRKYKNQKYTKEEVDIFAIYIVPLNDWYIMANDGTESVYVNRIEDKKQNWRIFYE